MDWRTVARHIDYGRGRAGSSLGPPCSVYRSTTNSGNFIQSSNLVLSNVRSFRRINTAKVDQESPERSFGTLMYEILVDAEFWEVGDVFVENDPFYSTGGTEVEFTTLQFEAYCLAFHGPVKKIMAARVDRNATLYRPVKAPDSSGYWSPTIGKNAAPVTCVGGIWSPSATLSDTPSKVPVGIQAMPRDREPIFRDVPGDTGQTAYFCYVPPLQGFNPREGDLIVTDGDTTSGVRYYVKHPFQQQAGFSGSQLLVSRVIGQD